MICHPLKTYFSLVAAVGDGAQENSTENATTFKVCYGDTNVKLPWAWVESVYRVCENAQSFETVIRPDEVIIDLPSEFVSQWYEQLNSKNHGWIILPNGSTIMIKMNILEIIQFMDSGIQVAQRCGFKVPMRVKLEYLVKDNMFKLHIVGVEGESSFIKMDMLNRLKR